MESFFSAALGQPHEYRAWFSDRVKLVLLAHGAHDADLPCRPQNSSAEYTMVAHTNAQVKQVLLDFDKVELQASKSYKVVAQHPAEEDEEEEKESHPHRRRKS